MDENGLSEEKATEKAATMVARPGTSEHNLGLAVDINSVETSFENSKAFKWLQENAEDFGFVLRYPKDKKAITKIIYEPWHYRYVGVEHAKEMNRLGMCLEEYIEYLKAQNN
jgi:D-alanyl-D-alanine carboxypeptidase